MEGQTPRQVWEPLLRHAVRAPSSHNTQPWRFVAAEDGRLHLYADRTRALPVVDPDGRELVMSCGAALAHLVIGLRHLGYAGNVATLPEPGDPDLLATVGFGPRRTPLPDDHRLFEAIGRRSTQRAAFEPRTVPPRLLTRLRAEAEGCGVSVQVLTGTPAQVASAAALVGEGDRLQFGDAGFRRELASWIRPNHTRRLDGIRGDALGLGSLASLLAPTIVARVDTGARQAMQDEHLALTAPALLLLSTEDDTPVDWLSAGQALGRLLLRGAADGLAASFLNQPIEVPALRARLGSLSGGELCPQLLLRVGHGDAGRLSARRPVAEVLEDGPPLSPVADGLPPEG